MKERGWEKEQRSEITPLFSFCFGEKAIQTLDDDSPTTVPVIHCMLGQATIEYILQTMAGFKIFCVPQTLVNFIQFSHCFTY